MALDANILAVGAPLGQSNGAVYSSVNSGDGKWKLIPHLLGEQSGDSFGSAVDLRNGQMVIGAQSRPIVNTLTPAGAAYFYEYNSTQGVWLQIGSEMRSSEDILAANGEFGAAVALGLNTFPRVVIGAPKSNKDMATLETGRLYTFENKGTSWNSIDASPLFGNNAYDWFGASLDMTSDGSRFIAGAPGNGTGSSGYFQIYYNGDSQWNVDFELVGTPDEALGSSVAVLSDAGDIFAVGGPGFGNGAGRVMVYQRQSSLRRNLGSTANNYVQLGDFVVGELGDRLGSQGSLSGGVFEDKLLLVIGTASGDVKTYSFNNFTNLWKLQFETLATGGNETAVIDYDSAADDVVTGFGNQDQVALYSRVAVSTSSTPTSSSTPRPASAPVASPTPALAPVAASGPPTTQTPLATPLATPPPPPSATSLATKAPTMTAVATNAPSMLPGMVNTPVPVNATTTAPSSTGLSSGSWILKGSSFTPIALSSGFGSSLSLASSTLAIGAPLTLGNGAVFIYRKVSGVWQTAASGQLFGSVNGGQFGAAVDVTDTFLIVGAPTVLANGTATQTGAAYCYIYSGQWTSLGGTLLGDTTVYGTNEQFGSAVAASTTARVVVGAPGSSAGLVKTRGRVYVFEFNATSSAWDLMQDELGTVADVALGSSVDISSDGNQFIVGAPGGNGYAELYTYNGSAWVSTFMSQGGSNEAYGSSVVLLSPTNNNIFAVGAPGYLNGQGRVVVYQKSGSGSFVQMGPDIVGVAGDRLGDVNKLSGGGVTPTVIVGTAQGSVKRFDYDSATNTWVQKGATVDTGFGGNLTAVAAASQSQTFAVGGNLDASLYALS